MMRKLRVFVCCIFIVIIISGGLLFCTQSYYEGLISKKYYDEFGENLTVQKFKSPILQSMGARQNDNLLMFGSSEFVHTIGYYTQPIKFFNGKKDGFQINLIGKGGYTCLIHVANFGALGTELKDQKVVFVVSPQWFLKGGVSGKDIEANSSELQIYGFLFNRKISLATKQKFSKRIMSIHYSKTNKNFDIIRRYCSLYSNKDLISTSKRYLLTPYYWIRYELLVLQDDISSNKYLKSNSKLTKYIKPLRTNINWNDELKKASSIAKSKSNNNKFGMDNIAYNNSFKKNLQKTKGSMKNDSYKVSPEYEDFKLMLDVCTEEGIKPLFLNIPVNGKWYDYAGFNKSDRLAYYKKIDNMVSSYGFEVADFSNYENEEHFLMDDSHIGWKGWIHVNEAIDKYYNKNN
ncbi:D-alanyl-lipoteichoic acid biosynthesis protein DltD [Clostridium estertheticum]|uniref:D-alanyl-lipoteichoic acid biosynthesis protein DltD n=1 Tax=Clostridium estertheticum TaxID=238834 RepID=UPI001C0D9BE0|nr:D-alanyl-lipoteichoic acid biosynthesis protein DltD [Clostridium estertheticum]MBU3186962.1 D-alanyl-lipoteichoic acid biosynthesis protein DltD [Clostridium estertheticum]